MKLKFIVCALLCLPLFMQAQYQNPFPTSTTTAFLPADENGALAYLPLKKKLQQRNHGMIIGLQRGRSTAIELGGEAHWRKISLKDPHIIGATANMEYNFGDHMIGYKAGMWMKRGRVNLTYGGNIGYHTNFKGRHIYSIGPAIGFRLAGLHLINGYNFLAGDTERTKDGSGVNTLYMSLRYYFPIDNKFTWDKSGRKAKQKEKAKKKKAREKEKQQKAREKEKAGNGETKKGLFGIKGLHF